MDRTADDQGKLVKRDLTPDEIKGRNTWIMWCGGNEAFWDWLASKSYGFVDLLKLVASPDHETAVQKRKLRFADAGMVNEPGFKPAADKDAYGLFVDVAVDPSQPAAPAGRIRSILGRGRASAIQESKLR